MLDCLYDLAFVFSSKNIKREKKTNKPFEDLA